MQHVVIRDSAIPRPTPFGVDLIGTGGEGVSIQWSALVAAYYAAQRDRLGRAREIVAEATTYMAERAERKAARWGRVKSAAGWALLVGVYLALTAVIVWAIQ